MFGKGMGKGMGFQAKTCVCPNCGHKMEVERGVPCRTVKCPKCGTPMMKAW